MKKIIIYIMTVMVLSCSNSNSNSNSKSNSNQERNKLGHDALESGQKVIIYNEDYYDNVVKNIYNQDGQILKKTTRGCENINNNERCIITEITFHYDKNGNLKNETMVIILEDSKVRPDTMETSFIYDTSNQLIHKYVIDASQDTIEKESTEYYIIDNNTKGIKKIKLKTISKLDKNETKLLNDTSITWLENIYEDTLLIEMRAFKLEDDEKKHKKSTFNFYNTNREIIKTIIVNEEKDTVNSSIYMYENEYIKEINSFLSKINIVTREIYDSNGCISKIVTWNQNTEKKDTVFYKTDKDCNIIEMKWN